jgi:hypothetical protein
MSARAPYDWKADCADQTHDPGYAERVSRQSTATLSGTSSPKDSPRGEDETVANSPSVVSPSTKSYQGTPEASTQDEEDLSGVNDKDPVALVQPKKKRKLKSDKKVSEVSRKDEAGDRESVKTCTPTRQKNKKTRNTVVPPIGTPDQEKGLRRSKRTRVPPLAFWKNEGPEYGPNDFSDEMVDDGLLCMSVVKYKQAEF